VNCFCSDFFASLQYTSHEHAGLCGHHAAQTSSASTIASTAQQMSVSFAVASASLVTAIFIPDRFHATPCK